MVRRTLELPDGLGSSVGAFLFQEGGLLQSQASSVVQFLTIPATTLHCSDASSKFNMTVLPDQTFEITVTLSTDSVGAMSRCLTMSAS